MRKILSLFLIIVLLFSLCIPVLADKNEKYGTSIEKVKYEIWLKISAESKKELVNRYKHNKIKMTDIEKEKRRKKIDSLISEMYIKGFPIDKIDKELAKYNVYRLEIPLETESTNSIAITSTEPADINMNKPIIYYDSQLDEWSVTGGGFWRNDNWFNDITGPWIGYKG